MAGRDRKGRREIYFEFRTLADYTQVCAIDPESGIEVTVAGPRDTPRNDLQRLALRKLKRRIEGAGNPDKPEGGVEDGIII